MSGSCEARNRKFANHITVFWKFLSRYLAFPLRLVQHLFHILHRIASRRFQRIHTNGRPERVAGSSQPPIMPRCNAQSFSIPGPGPAGNIPILPIHSTPLSSTRALQPPSAALVSINSQNEKFEPFVPSEVKRYNKDPTM